MSAITNEQINQILLDALNAPKSVKNDSGEVESQDLNKVVEALKYAGKLGVSKDPFSCLKTAKVKYRDAWQERV